MLITTESRDPAFEEAIRRLRYTREERERLFPPKEPFNFAEWRRESPPATQEELAEMEEFLREREAEREASLAAEANAALCYRARSAAHS